MTRRGLLGLLGAAVLDPERLLWVPGARLISIPARPKIRVSYRREVTPHGGIWQERWGVYDPRRGLYHFCATYYFNQRLPPAVAPHLPDFERATLARRLGVSPADLDLDAVPLASGTRMGL